MTRQRVMAALCPLDSSRATAPTRPSRWLLRPGPPAEGSALPSLRSPEPSGEVRGKPAGRGRDSGAGPLPTGGAQIQEKSHARPERYLPGHSCAAPAEYDRWSFWVRRGDWRWPRRLEDRSRRRELKGCLSLVAAILARFSLFDTPLSIYISLPLKNVKLIRVTAFLRSEFRTRNGGRWFRFILVAGRDQRPSFPRAQLIDAAGERDQPVG
jgi:hypothetical protein